MAESETTTNDMLLTQGRTFCWHELYVPRTEGAIDFYTSTLDFGTTEMDMGMGNYKMLTRNGVPVCGVVSTEEMQMGNIPPHWSTFISVDDVDKRLKMCEEKGAKLVHGPVDMPSVGRMVLISDPDGAHVWLFTPTARQ